MDVLDLRELADEWQALVPDIDDVVDSELCVFATDINPRFPRLHRAVIAHNAIVEALENAAADLAPYEALAEEVGVEATPDALRDWADDFEPTLIHETYFEDYARELADDCGMLDKDAGWPANHIDWDAAADALKQDYTTVEYDGDTYFLRSC